MFAEVKTKDSLDNSGALLHTSFMSADDDEHHPVALDNGSLLEAFSTAYPAYTGDLRHFTNLVGEIKRARNPLHHFLWDDYVIRNKTDYLPYSIECLNAGERPIPYDAFYAKRIPKPLYLEGVLTPIKLEAMYGLDDSRYVTRVEKQIIANTLQTLKQKRSIPASV